MLIIMLKISITQNLKWATDGCAPGEACPQRAHLAKQLLSARTHRCRTQLKQKIPLALTTSKGFIKIRCSSMSL